MANDGTDMTVTAEGIPRIDTVFINLKSDWGFKRLFGSPEHSEILRRFLNALFEGEMVITTLTFKDKEVLPESSDGKRVFYDVHCKTETGHHFVVEMQQQETASFAKRMEYYMCAANYKQGIKGKGYSNNPVYLVALTNFDMAEFERQLLNKVLLIEETTHRVFSRRLRMFFISLEHVKEEWDDCENELERQLYLIKNMENLNKESKPYLSGEYSDIFDASEVATMACEEIVDYHKSLMRMAEMDEIREEGFEEGMEKGMQEGMEKGMQEGMEKGMEKGIMSMVKSMFSNGLSLDLIAKCSNLPLPQIQLMLQQ